MVNVYRYYDVSGDIRNLTLKKMAKLLANTYVKTSFLINCINQRIKVNEVGQGLL